MKIFEHVRLNLASLGYRPNQSPFNKTQLWTYIKVFLNLFSLCAYIFRGPSTPKEYVDSIFMTAATILFLIARVSTLFKNDTIFLSIDSIEKTINGSELLHLKFFSILLNAYKMKLVFLSRIKTFSIEKNA